jgi:ABC-2 type transport system permease protein
LKLSATANAGAPAPPVSGGSDALLPRTLPQIVELSRFQMRDYLRSRRFILMMALVVAIGTILTVVVGYFRPGGLLASSADFYGTLWGSGVTVVIIFAGVIFGSDAIAGEFQNKTGYFLMGLPLRRVTVYVGKYIAAFIASLIAVILFAMIIVANATYYFGSDAFTGALAESFVLAIVYLLALLGATFLFSSMFKTSTYATLVVAVLFLFGFTLLQDLVQGLAHITPWFIISYSDTIIGGVFNTSCETAPGNHVCMSPGPGGRTFSVTVDNPTIPLGVAIMLGYFVVTSIAGLLIFEREEFS